MPAEHRACAVGAGEEPGGIDRVDRMPLVDQGLPWFAEDRGARGEHEASHAGVAHRPQAGSGCRRS
jgi:hypothetical protein